MAITKNIGIDIHIWHRIHQTLINAKGNAYDLLNDTVDNAKGDNENSMSKRESVIADMYETELREINSLLEYTSNNNGVPF